MSTSSVSVQILPARCYFDEPVQIVVQGLCPEQTVTLTAKVKDDKGMIFQSSAEYQANENGEVDLNCSPCLAGSYSGVEPMGLFWSLLPLTPHNKLTWWDASRPLVVDIEVISQETPGRVLCKETLERLFLKEGVHRVVVTDGRIRGTLFVPPG